jgi:hypothetical protein
VVSKTGCKSAGEPENSLQHFRSSGLLLHASVRSVCALAKIVSALPEFVEQPRILDGDHGLSGEVRDQSDLLVSKGTNFPAGVLKDPISSFSFSIGTVRNVLMPPSSTAATVSGRR